MKRFLLCGVLLALLAGCGTAGEQLPEEVPEETEPLSGEELTASAMAAYAEITKDLTFTLDVEEEDAQASASPSPRRPPGTWRDGRTCSPSATSGSRPRRRPGGDQWSDIKSRGRLFAMTAPDGETTLQCCTGGDVVLWTVDGETHYACVTAAAEGESGLSGLLQGIAEDALWDAAFCGPTVDGAETDYEEIARQLNEAVAENVRHVPGWASGCWWMTRMERWPTAGRRGPAWESRTRTDLTAGAGRAAIRKNADGDWYCADMGTGGYSAELPLSAAGEDAPISELVDAFFLTDGTSHDWLVPNYILHHTVDEMEALPALLDRRTDAEARALCAALGTCLRDSTWDNWTVETLAAALGRYGAYLDV